MVALELALKALARPLPLPGDWVDSSIFIAMFALVLTIAISAASYRLLETPFLRLKSRFALIPSRPT
jgi:peptidoglycan/LPS O-acetylase OafA/YrhL